MSKELAVTQQKPKLLERFASFTEMDSGTIWGVLQKTVLPPDCSNEEGQAFVATCVQHGLNPFLREIYAFKQNGKIVPLVGVDGWAKKANEHPAYDGIEFEDGDGFVTCRVYRKDRSKPTSVTEYMTECSKNTEPWRKSPRRMLRHRAYIQAVRLAFGISGLKDEDDFEIERAREISVTAQTTTSPASPANPTESREAVRERVKRKRAEPAVVDVVPEPVTPAAEAKAEEAQLQEEVATEDRTKWLDDAHNFAPEAVEAVAKKRHAASEDPFSALVDSACKVLPQVWEKIKAEINIEIERQATGEKQ